MKIRCMVRGCVALVWAALAVDAIPGVEVVPTDQLRMLLLSVAITGSLAFVVCQTRQPIEEVFDAGRDYERKLLMKQMSRQRRVTGNQPSIWAARGASRMAANPSRARSDTSLSIRP